MYLCIYNRMDSEFESSARPEFRFIQCACLQEYPF